MKTPKPKLLTSKGKSPLFKLGVSASKKSTVVQPPGKRKNYKKANLPEQAFAIPGFGDTGLTGES